MHPTHSHHMARLHNRHERESTRTWPGRRTRASKHTATGGRAWQHQAAATHGVTPQRVNASQYTSAKRRVITPPPVPMREQATSARRRLPSGSTRSRATPPTPLCTSPAPCPRGKACEAPDLPHDTCGVDSPNLLLARGALLVVQRLPAAGTPGALALAVGSLPHLAAHALAGALLADLQDIRVGGTSSITRSATKQATRIGQERVQRGAGCPPQHVRRAQLAARAAWTPFQQHSSKAQAWRTPRTRRRRWLGSNFLASSRLS